MEPTPPSTSLPTNTPIPLSKQEHRGTTLDENTQQGCTRPRQTIAILNEAVQCLEDIDKDQPSVRVAKRSASYEDLTCMVLDQAEQLLSLIRCIYNSDDDSCDYEEQRDIRMGRVRRGAGQKMGAVATDDKDERDGTGRADADGSLFEIPASDAKGSSKELGQESIDGLSNVPETVFYDESDPSDQIWPTPRVKRRRL